MKQFIIEHFLGVTMGVGTEDPNFSRDLGEGGFLRGWWEFYCGCFHCSHYQDERWLL